MKNLLLLFIMLICSNTYAQYLTKDTLLFNSYYYEVEEFDNNLNTKLQLKVLEFNNDSLILKYIEGIGEKSILTEKIYTFYSKHPDIYFKDKVDIYTYKEENCKEPLCTIIEIVDYEEESIFKIKEAIGTPIILTNLFNYYVKSKL